MLAKPLRLASVALLALSFSAVASSARAQQQDDDIHDAVTVNVLDAIDGFFNLAWEHALGRHFSLQLGAEVYAFRGVFDKYDGEMIAVGPTLGLNWYLVGDAPQGFFLGPYVIGAWLHADDGNRTKDDFGYAVGARIGGSVVLGNFFLGGSIGGHWRDFRVSIDDSRVGPQGFRPRFDLSLGVAF